MTGNIADQTDYSGFELCPLRDIVEHRRQVDDVLGKTTQEERNRAESQYGVRYSELLRLPYFDCIRFTVIDPMHNLFLGTAKHVMETWIDASVLTPADLQKAQDKVDSVHVPTNIGRIPGKIAKSSLGFTAENVGHRVFTICVKWYFARCSLSLLASLGQGMQINLYSIG